jgi:hypothetical protein
LRYRFCWFNSNFAHRLEILLATIFDSARIKPKTYLSSPFRLSRTKFLPYQAMLCLYGIHVPEELDLDLQQIFPSPGMPRRMKLQFIHTGSLFRSCRSIVRTPHAWPTYLNCFPPVPCLVWPM